MKETLEVLSFNAWMLRTPLGLDIARHVDERIALIPKNVAETGADIIALQEVWDPDLRHRLEVGFRREGYAFSAWRGDLESGNQALAMTSLAAGIGPLLAAHTQQRADSPSRRAFLKHCALFAGSVGLNAWGAGSLVLSSFRRAMGNGLMIVSRYEIEPEVAQLRFTRHTRTDEALVVKGAIGVTIKHPRLGPIDVFNSHLGAVSYEADQGRYSPAETRDRLHQTRELVDWVRRQRRHRLAFLALDLNADHREFREGRYIAQPSAEHLALTEDLGWINSYLAVNSGDDRKAITDDSRNPYKSDGHFQGSPDCVIDYVFAAPAAGLTVDRSRVVFNEPLSEAAAPALRLSDHYGVLSRFEIG